jgi:hypothetical protein
MRRRTSRPPAGHVHAFALNAGRYKAFDYPQRRVASARRTSAFRVVKRAKCRSPDVLFFPTSPRSIDCQNGTQTRRGNWESARCPPLTGGCREAGVLQAGVVSHERRVGSRIRSGARCSRQKCRAAVPPEGETGQYAEVLQCVAHAATDHDEQQAPAPTVARTILNRAARVWRTNGRPWLGTSPLIEMLNTSTASRRPRPITWREQHELLKDLPGHLERMRLLALNTGARDENVCGLRWDWEVKVQDAGRSVFVVPAAAFKGKATTC